MQSLLSSEGTMMRGHELQRFVGVLDQFSSVLSEFAFPIAAGLLRGWQVQR